MEACMHVVRFYFGRQHREVLHGRGVEGATGVIAFATRGWGKTRVSMHLAAEAALSTLPTETCLWLTPVSDQFRGAWRELRRNYWRFIRKAVRTDGRVEFVDAGALEFRSAFDPDHLRGKTYRAVVLDEASLIPAEGWQSCIRPTQRRSADWFVLLTTPRGRDWVWALGREEHGVQGTGNRIHETWNMEHETWNREQGTGKIQHGTWNREHGTGDRKHGIEERERRRDPPRRTY